jgi:hypothetical protein
MLSISAAILSISSSDAVSLAAYIVDKNINNSFKRKQTVAQ